MKSYLIKAILALTVLVAALFSHPQTALTTDKESRPTFNSPTSTSPLALFGLTNKEARDAALSLGYEEVKGQFSSKQLVFKA